MNKKLLAIILLIMTIAIGLVSCTESNTPGTDVDSSGSIGSSSTITESTTPKVHVTTTPIAEETEILATPTEETLRSIDHLGSGTYFVYVKPNGDQYELVFVDSDGYSRMSRTYPIDNPYSLNNVKGLSPDGKYYAYYTGTAGEWGQLDVDATYDLRLNIVSLNDGELIIEIPLLSEDYPANFPNAVESVREKPGANFEWSTDDEVALILYQAFLAGIGSHEWSPDGRYLAFAAQMDGPSSDLYIFDSDNLSIRRLSSGPEQIYRIEWSPDGRHIMHASSYWIGVNPPLTNHSARVDGSEVVTFPIDQGELEDGWLNNYQYLAHEGANGIGEYDIKLFDVREKTVDTIWPHPFQYFKFHPNHNSMVVTMIEPQSAMDPGVFIVDTDTRDYLRMDTGLFFEVEPLNSDDYLYAVSQVDEGTYLINTIYELEKISDLGRRLEVSPDMQLLALYGLRDEAGLDILSIDSGLNTPIFDYDVDWVEWAPDLSSIFFASGDSIFFYGLSTGRMVEIDEMDEDLYPRWGGFEFIQAN